MSDVLPTLLVPGLLCTGQLYTHQYSLLWHYGPVMVADPVHDETIAAIAQRILSNAPPQFRLAGLSMGGYIALEIMRVAPQRVLKLALLDTSARPDSAEAGVMRRDLIARAKAGEFAQIPDATYPNAVHPSRLDDSELKQINRQMAVDVGLDAYLRQQTAIMARHDARPNLKDIQCPTTIIVGEDDKITPIVCAEEMASGIRGATLHVIAECGHMSTLEQPQAVNTALASWLNA